MNTPHDIAMLINQCMGEVLLRGPADHAINRFHRRVNSPPVMSAADEEKTRLTTEAVNELRAELVSLVSPGAPEQTASAGDVGAYAVGAEADQARILAEQFRRVRFERDLAQDSAETWRRHAAELVQLFADVDIYALIGRNQGAVVPFLTKLSEVREMLASTRKDIR